MSVCRVSSSAILLVLIAGSGCHDHSPTSPSPVTVPAGAWGGTQASLTVSPTGGVWQQFCANGTIDKPMMLDATGHFDAGGTLTRNMGGPIGTGGQHPARYTGMTDGNTMTMTIVTTDDGTTFGPFQLTFGRETQVGPCPLV